MSFVLTYNRLFIGVALRVVHWGSSLCRNEKHVQQDKLSPAEYSAGGSLRRPQWLCSLLQLVEGNWIAGPDLLQIPA
eukprot:1570060-Amphidinium_carterae.1